MRCPIPVLLAFVIVGCPNGAAPLRAHGSFMLAAICRDGIVVATDSRSTLKDSHGKAIAYFDSSPKIFSVRVFTIAYTGHALLNDPKLSWLSAFVEEFARSRESDVPLEQLLPSLITFAEKRLSPEGRLSARQQTFISAGYAHGAPRLCYYQGQSDGSYGCISSGYLPCSSSEPMRLAWPLGQATVRVRNLGPQWEPSSAP
jgi:hypothetical protein